MGRLGKIKEMEQGTNKKEKIKYERIGTLKIIAMFGIVLMHIKANTNYDIKGFVYNSIIQQMGSFVFLFMMISAFGLCCGYYEQAKSGAISWPLFYKKRFLKSWPFFAVMVLIDICISPSWNAVKEAFADLTMLFGFIPNAEDISVIGVGWFLGTIFVFYLCFPFFCFLLENKRRAVFSFLVSMIYHYIATSYFEVRRNNILYCGMYFLAGGLAYLYRDEIGKIKQVYIYLLLACSIAVSCFSFNSYVKLLLFASMLLWGVGKNRKEKEENKIKRFLLGISLEIYLSHMVIFRGLELVGLTQLVGNRWGQYLLTSLLTIIGTVVFSYIIQCGINKTQRFIVRVRENENSKTS